VKYRKKDRSAGVAENRRTIYRLANNAGTIELESLETFTGGRTRQNDELFAFNGNLYFTITRGEGRQTRVYRSTDNGSTWGKVADIGFAKPHFENEIQDIVEANGAIHIIVAQADNEKNHQKVGVWSSTTGTNWTRTVVDLPTTEYVTKYFYEANHVGSEHFYVVVQAVQYGDDNATSPNSNDVYKTLIFVTADATNWIEQTVSTPHDTDFAASSYEVTASALIDDVLYVTTEAFGCYVLESFSWFGSGEELGDIVWATGDNITSASLDTSSATLAAAGGAPYLFFTDDTTTAYAQSLTYDSTAQTLTTTPVDSVGGVTESVFGEFVELGDMVAYIVNDRNDTYEVVIFNGDTWSEIYTLPINSGNYVHDFMVFDTAYFYATDTQQIYRVTTGGDLVVDTVGFEGELSSDLVVNANYTISTTTPDNLVLVKAVVHDRDASEDLTGKIWHRIDEQRIVADRGLDWQVIDYDVSLDLGRTYLQLNGDHYFVNLSEDIIYQLELE
jgi:hypothetical protein